MSEEILIRQGAPTLAGIKTGSLFPCPCEDHEALMTDIRRLNRRLSPKGLCLLPLRFLPGRALLYLYRPAGLRRDLRDAQASELLRQAALASPDIDGDGVVGITDFLLLLADWGPCPAPPEYCPADLDGDGVVGIEDFLLLLASWG